MRRLWILAAILALAACVGLTARAAPREPAPLRGAPLGAETGLKLLIADDPPLVLDVDTGKVVSSGIQASAVPIWVVGVGGRGAAVVGGANLYAVRGRQARVAPLGAGTNVWPAADGRSAWVQDTVARSRCTLRRVGLDGRKLRAARPFPCATVSDPPGGSLGLVVGRTRVVDPSTGRLLVRTRWGILAAAGSKLVLAGPGEELTLLDGKTRTERRLQWPSILPFTDRPAVDPSGRFVALAFAVPSWRGGGSQVLDVWLLDTTTGKLTQLPGMPAFVSLKRTDIAWTDDGRLVLLGESGGRDVVAVWRPGQARLALKTVNLPERDGGSDSFAPLGQSGG